MSVHLGTDVPKSILISLVTDIEKRKLLMEVCITFLSGKIAVRTIEAHKAVALDLSSITPDEDSTE